MRSVLHVLLALLAFAYVAGFQGALVPRPSDYGMRAKMEYWREHADGYDVLFVGSSITTHGLVPAEFDRVLAERGHGLRSFNLGVPAMVSLEGNHMLLEALEHAGERLKYVFVEGENWSPIVYSAANQFADRTVHWHDVRHTRYALEALPRMPKGPNEAEGFRRDQAIDHVRLLAYKLTAGSRGRELVSALPFVDSDPPLHAFVTEQTLAAAHGYIDPNGMAPDHPEVGRWQARRERFQRTVDQYIRDALSIDAQNEAPVTSANHFQLRGLREQMAAIRAAGAEPVYFTGPRLAPTAIMYALAREGVVPAYFGFNRPRTYEALYRPDNHEDNNHLNPKGALEWSRVFATEFADWLDAREQ